MRLSRNFFEQKTLKVAKDLLGCFLIRKIGQKIMIAKIIETEAYCGPKDLANHASKGRTQRTAVMFGQAGRAYIYLIYGMYYCFNVVTEKRDYPAAVLIRGVEIIHDLKFSITPPACLRSWRAGNFQLPMNFQFLNFKLQKQATINKQQTTKIIGPGKVCRELKIDKNFQGADLIKDNHLYFIRLAERFIPRRIKTLPRVGVDYAKEYKDKKWRFVLEC